MSTKAVIAGLVVVAVLFGLALLTGAGERAGDAGAEPGGLLGRVLDRFADQATVDDTEISGCAISDSVIGVPVGGCTLRVAGSGERLRLLRLSAVDPLSVRAPAPDADDLTITKRLTAGEEVEVAVDGGGADVVLRCTGVGPCSVRLRDADS